MKSFFSAFSLTWWSSSAFCFAFVASTTACTCSSVRNGQWSMPTTFFSRASFAALSSRCSFCCSASSFPSDRRTCCCEYSSTISPRSRLRESRCCASSSSRRASISAFLFTICCSCDASTSGIDGFAAAFTCGRCGRCSGASGCVRFGSPGAALPVSPRPAASGTPPRLFGGAAAAVLGAAAGVRGGVGVGAAASAADDAAAAPAAPGFAWKWNSSDLFSQMSFPKTKSIVTTPSASSAHDAPIRSTMSRSAASTTSRITTSPTSSVVICAIFAMSTSTLSDADVCVFGRRSCRPCARANASASTNIGFQNSRLPMTSCRMQNSPMPSILTPSFASNCSWHHVVKASQIRPSTALSHDERLGCWKTRSRSCCKFSMVQEPRWPSELSGGGSEIE